MKVCLVFHPPFFEIERGTTTSVGQLDESAAQALPPHVRHALFEIKHLITVAGSEGDKVEVASANAGVGSAPVGGSAKTTSDEFQDRFGAEVDFVEIVAGKANGGARDPESLIGTRKKRAPYASYECPRR